MLTAAGVAMKAGYDYFYPYYRDRALCLQLGMTPLEMLLSAVGAEDDPNSHGRQMPSHWGHKKLNIVTQSSPTGTQLLQAVGCAEASYRGKLIPELQKIIAHFHGDEVAYVSLGDGTSSQGEFWEALNTASNLKLPVLFLLEDNGYAISVPVEVQTPGGDVSRLIENFPSLYLQRCDGTDPIESLEVMRRAVDYCRQRKGPAFVHAKVIRPYSHSLSDDEKLYRPDEERASEAERDPVKRFGALLIDEGVIDQDGLQKIKDEVDREVNEAADKALASQQPAPETATHYVFSPDVDPTSKEFDTETPCSFPAMRERWSISSIAVSKRKWRAIRASWCLVKTWPTVRANNISKALKAKAACSKSPRTCSESSAAPAFSTRRSRKQTSSGAASAWRRAG